MRLGLLQSTAAIDRQTRAAAAAELAKKRHHPVPTVKTEAQTAAEAEKAAKKGKDKGGTVGKEKGVKEKGESGSADGGGGGTAVTAAAETSKSSTSTSTSTSSAKNARIRPLSEAKAIDSGATFLSEAFLFIVGASLILFESFRARRKESKRRNDVDDRIRDLEAAEEAYKAGLIALEKEILELHREMGVQQRGEHGGREKGMMQRRILPETIYDVSETEGGEGEVKTWYMRAWEYAREASDAVKQRIERSQGQEVKDRESSASEQKPQSASTS